MGFHLKLNPILDSNYIHFCQSGSPVCHKSCVFLIIIKGFRIENLKLCSIAAKAQKCHFFLEIEVLLGGKVYSSCCKRVY